MSSAKLKFYQKEATKTQLADASPYQVVQMLMGGVLDSLALAKGALQRQDYEVKGRALSKASAILNALRSTLDESLAPDLTQNLYALYTYMLERLIDAAVEKQNADAIDEVARLFREIKSAWDEIPLQAQLEAEAARNVTANVG
jgi:flagellar protein FliS